MALGWRSRYPSCVECLAQPQVPDRSDSLAGDVWSYLLARPKVPTLVDLASTDDRQAYCGRIVERLGVRVDNFTVLNIHRIGVNAPLDLVWNTVMTWNAGASYWPSRMAWPERQAGNIFHIEIYLMGWKRAPRGLGSRLFGLPFIPLFRLDLLKIQQNPALGQADKPRFLLYECSGGYPIGIFSIYVREAIEGRGEREPSQVFFLVAFDFYGRKELAKWRVLRWIWTGIHNRVTANVLGRFKQFCEKDAASTLVRSEDEPRSNATEAQKSYT